MTELRTARTADLGTAEMAAIRSLMDAAFSRSDDTFYNVSAQPDATSVHLARLAAVTQTPPP